MEIFPQDLFFARHKKEKSASILRYAVLFNATNSIMTFI